MQEWRWRRWRWRWWRWWWWVERSGGGRESSRAITTPRQRNFIQEPHAESRRESNIPSCGHRKGRRPVNCFNCRSARTLGPLPPPPLRRVATFVITRPGGAPPGRECPLQLIPRNSPIHGAGTGAVVVGSAMQGPGVIRSPPPKPRGGKKKTYRTIL